MRSQSAAAEVAISTRGRIIDGDTSNNARVTQAAQEQCDALASFNAGRSGSDRYRPPGATHRDWSYRPERKRAKS
jgi:hypothetical protein